jgi:hypothetical protein
MQISTPNSKLGFGNFWLASWNAGGKLHGDINSRNGNRLFDDQIPFQSQNEQSDRRFDNPIHIPVVAIRESIKLSRL